jgi:hypothetical protein
MTPLSGDAALLVGAPRLVPHLEKLVLTECPDVLKVIDWKEVRNLLMSMLRDETRLVDLEPPKKN